jgi:hypothetical protein
LKFFPALFIRAVSFVEGLPRLPQSNNERALAHLLCGQVHDLQGARAAALRCYDEVIALQERYGADYMTGINRLVSALALEYRKKPFSRKAIFDIPIGFSQTSGVE